MKKYTTRHRFAPYASRKNKKRALGVRQKDNQPVTPRTESLHGMGPGLMGMIAHAMGTNRGQ